MRAWGFTLADGQGDYFPVKVFADNREAARVAILELAGTLEEPERSVIQDYLADSRRGRVFELMQNQYPPEVRWVRKTR